jgi:hypothetical protein
MPFVLIYTDDDVADLVKLFEQLADADFESWEFGDAVLVRVEPGDDGPPGARSSAARRQARYRQRQKAARGTVGRRPRPADDDDEGAESVTRRVTQGVTPRNAVTRNDRNESVTVDAEILPIFGGSNTLSPDRAERVLLPDPVTRDVTRDVTRNAVTRNARNADAGEEWRSDARPLDDDERARAHAGLAAARAALRESGRP